MSSAGYSKSVSKRTDKLVKTKGWQELMEKHLPDALLAKKHKEGLDAYRIEKGAVIGGEAGIVPVEMQTPDFATRHKYLETAYKIKNKMPKETPITAIQVNVGDDRAEFTL